MPRYVILPANLCSEKKHDGVSIYYRDYCSRHKYNKSRRPNYNTRKEKVIINDPTADQHLTLPYGYGDQEFNATIDTIKSNEQNEKEMNKLIDNAPETLRKIENAWISEIDTNKRARGRIYGVAGSKMNIHQRKSKSENDKALPGLNKWLETANEYEKEVVHKFVSSINNSVERENSAIKSSRNSSRQESSARQRSISAIDTSMNERLRSAPNPNRNKGTDHIKSVRIRSAPITPNSFRPNTNPINLSRKQTPMRRNEEQSKDLLENNISSVEKSPAHGLMEQTDNYEERASNLSRGSSRSSMSSGAMRSHVSTPPKEVLTPSKDIFTQIPYKYGSKPSSPVNDKLKSKSTPDLSHNCQQCETCRKKEVKKLLEQICKNSPESYDYIRLQRALQPQNNEEEVVIPQEDYVHASTSFHKVNGLKKRYFIIHPDFVSENGGNLRTKRRLQKKYFGESKVAAY